MRHENLKTPDQIYYVLDSPISKQWIGYRLILLDLDYIGKSLNELISIEGCVSHNKDIYKKSLWLSSVVTYGKCFCDASQGRGVKLESNVISKRSKELYELHEEIIQHRHHYVTHAGGTVFEFLEPRIRLSQRGGETYYPHLVYQGHTLNSFNNEIIKGFISLVEILKMEVKSKSDKIGEKILEMEVKEKSREEMLKLMKEQNDEDLR